MNEVTVLEGTKSLSISEMIEIKVPKTNDRGDALACAVQILEAAWHAVYLAGTDPEYRQLVYSIKVYLAKQHIAWMKGDN